MSGGRSTNERRTPRGRFYRRRCNGPGGRRTGPARVGRRTDRGPKLHRRGVSARDIHGANLLYEIEGEKYVLIQYKTPSSAGRVSRDETQLDTLVASCPEGVCYPRASWPHCGSWHCVRAVARSFYHRPARRRRSSDPPNHGASLLSPVGCRSRRLMSCSHSAGSARPLR
jgi:hypothetical protein